MAIDRPRNFVGPLPKILSGMIVLAFLVNIGRSEDQNDTEPKRPLTLEAEITRGKEVSQLRVYIRNHTRGMIAFRTGAAGGPGSLNDQLLTGSAKGRTSLILGSAPTVLPVYYFKFGEGQIAIRPPVISGPTSRVMRPEYQKLPAESRTLYASFSVPNHQIEGGFERCELILQGQDNAPSPDIIGPWEERLSTKELREADAEESR